MGISNILFKLLKLSIWGLIRTVLQYCFMRKNWESNGFPQGDEYLQPRPIRHTNGRSSPGFSPQTPLVTALWFIFESKSPQNELKSSGLRVNGDSNFLKDICWFWSLARLAKQLEWNTYYCIYISNLHEWSTSQDTRTFMSIGQIRDFPLQSKKMNDC